MMSLEMKYYLRRDILNWVYQLVTPISWILVIMFIRFAKFAKYGFQMYGGSSEKLVTVPKAMEYFLDQSIWPLMPYLLLMIPVDLFIVRPLYRKYVLR